MLNADGQWSEYLAGNNITGIIQCLRRITDNGGANTKKILPVFSCWVQRTSELAKKELLTLCFSHCQGLWMFLDRSSFTRVHILLQKLRNLLTLAQWSVRHYGSAHLWHGVGAPCTVCCGACTGCWNLGERSIKQHIWLGRLVQWWGIMGLLPKYPEAQEEKRICQMWKEMDQSHRKACAEMSGLKEDGMEQGSSFIQGMVSELVKQHGCIWMWEDHVDQDYPPPSLQALLKLVFVPRVDNISVQAIIMYFVLDMANFLQCRDDLLQSFCRAFTIPSSFSQQIRAFWLLDHGHIKASVELLLSPRAAAPQLSWQHRYIIHCLLLKKQPRQAWRYLQWARPAMETVEDVKLCADVLLQNGRVSEAWALLRRGHSQSQDLVTHFLQACDGFGLCAEALKYVPAGYRGKRDDKITASQFPKITKGRPPRPLSATLYQAQRVNAVSSEELIQLVTTAVMEVRQPHPKIREVAWPRHTETHSATREMFLSTEALCHLTPSPWRIDPADGSEPCVHRSEPAEERTHENQPNTPEHISSSGSSAIEDLSFASSVSSFASASSLPPLRGDRPYIYESTLTLQRISALLTDGLNHRSEEEVTQRREEEEQGSEEEEEEEEEEEPEETELEDEVEEEVSPPPSSADAFTDSSELTVILDGSSAPITLVNLSKDISVVHISTGDETDPAQRRDPLCGDAFSGLPVPETLSSNDSFDPVSFEPHTEEHSFLFPGKMDLSLDQEDVPSQLFDFSGAAMSDCLQEKWLFQVQRAYEQHHQEEPEEPYREDLLCAQAETLHHLQTDVQQRFHLDEPVAGSQALNPADPLITNIQTSSSSSDAPHENISQMQLTAKESSVQSSSGSWWKHNLESHPVSSSRKLPVTEAGADSPERPCVGPGQPYAYSFFNFTEKHKGDDRKSKQTDKEYAAGWSSVGKDSQGAIRSRSRKGKRVKRT